MNWHSLGGTRRFLRKQQQKRVRSKKVSLSQEQVLFSQSPRKRNKGPTWFSLTCPGETQSLWSPLRGVSEVNENGHEICFRQCLITRHLESSPLDWQSIPAIIFCLIIPLIWTLFWRNPLKGFPCTEPCTFIVKGNVEMLKPVCSFMDEETGVQEAQGLAWGPTVI